MTFCVRVFCWVHCMYVNVATKIEMFTEIVNCLWFLLADGFDGGWFIIKSKNSIEFKCISYKIWMIWVSKKYIVRIKFMDPKYTE